MFRCTNPLYKVQFVLLEDDSTVEEQFSASSPGIALLDFISAHIRLQEKDYFGLRFHDKSGQIHWLDLQEPLKKQFGSKSKIDIFLAVKYYLLDPSTLQDELTRYLFFLQLKRDILSGRLPLGHKEAARLFGYILQAELGNFNPVRDDKCYSSQFKFVPGQSYQLEQRAEEFHATLKNLTTAEAELRFLQEAKSLDFYGVDMHSVLGDGMVEYQVGLCASGLLIFRNNARVAVYMWSRVAKVRRSKTHVSVTVLGRYGNPDVHTFMCNSDTTSKHLFKCVRDHHAFFRFADTDRAGLASTQPPQVKFNSSSSSSRVSFRRQPMPRSAKRDPPPAELRRNSRDFTEFKLAAFGRGIDLTARDGGLPSSRENMARRVQRSKSPRNRTRKYYVPRSSAGSDTESYTCNRMASINNVAARRQRRSCVSDDEQIDLPVSMQASSENCFVDSAAQWEMVQQRQQFNKSSSTTNASVASSKPLRQNSLKYQSPPLPPRRTTAHIVYKPQFAPLSPIVRTEPPSYDEHAINSAKHVNSPRVSRSSQPEIFTFSSPFVSSPSLASSKPVSVVSPRTQPNSPSLPVGSKGVISNAASEDSGIGVSNMRLADRRSCEQVSITCHNRLQGHTAIRITESSDTPGSPAEPTLSVSQLDTSGFERSTFTVVL